MTTLRAELEAMIAELRFEPDPSDPINYAIHDYALDVANKLQSILDALTTRADEGDGDAPCSACGGSGQVEVEGYGCSHGYVACNQCHPAAQVKVPPEYFLADVPAPHHDGAFTQRAYRDGWNACRAATLRLNPVTQAAGEVGGWLPIESAPAEGDFLVYMPNERQKIQAAHWHPNVKTIGHVFAFDLTKPTHWLPLPPPPAKEGE